MFVSIRGSSFICVHQRLPAIVPRLRDDGWSICGWKSLLSRSWPASGSRLKPTLQVDILAAGPLARVPSGQHSFLRRLTVFFVRMFERYTPDPYVLLFGAALLIFFW